jgi:Domain of unknown function (DUF4430)
VSVACERTRAIEDAARRRLAAASTAVAIALLLAAVASAGCGLGPGEEVDDVELTVTRDYGTVPVLHRRLGDVTEADTVMRVLERNAEIETRYGGGFVHSIDGLEAEESVARSLDWFYFVDGVEASVGAADYPLRGGESIWWDYRDWSATMRVPAVVGSWPAPFRQGYEGRGHPVAIECMGGGSACDTVRERLEGAGAEIAPGGVKGEIRVLVGPWVRVRRDPAAALIEDGPTASGVFAVFEAAGESYEMSGLDEDGEVARRFGAGAGLVAATRRLGAPPVWVVSGIGAVGVRAAAGLLDRGSLRDRYAVAVEGERETAVPLR